MSGPNLRPSDVERRRVIDETMAILEEVDKRVAAENLAGAIRQLLRANRNLLRVISEMGEDRGST